MTAKDRIAGFLWFERDEPFAVVPSAFSRPTARTSSGIASSFAYSDRSEVVSAQIGTNLFAHVYDYIGNCEEEFKERK